jgi:hypothetical protein
LSSSFFENQEVTVDIKLSKSTDGDGISSETETGFYFAKKITACAGILASVCEQVVDIKGIGIAVISKGDRIDRDETESESTATISFTLSYSTSNSPALGQGFDSTMILVPALNIVFSKSLRVTYNSTTCMATGTEVNSWSLFGMENFKVWI